jgi:hypothetical protein
MHGDQFISFSQQKALGKALQASVGRGSGSECTESDEGENGGFMSGIAPEANADANAADEEEDDTF